MVITSFLLSLCFFLLIGILSVYRAKNTSEDYFVAGRAVHPWLVGMSAFATGNTGWMFVAQTSYSYQEGLSSMWLLIFWPIGDFFASLFFHKKFMKASGESNAISFGEVIEKWGNKNKKYNYARFFSGIVIFLFLSLYAASQFKSGSKVTHVIFGWDQSWGVLAGAILVLIYSWSGGIRATIWTDVLQGALMIFSMGILFFNSVSYLGGWDSFVQGIYSVSPNYMSLFKDSTLEHGLFFGPFLFLMGWFFGGLGVLGQPHIMTRFMSMDISQSLWKARMFQYPSVLLFSAFCVGTGLAARVIFPEIDFEPELIFPFLSMKILPEIFVGIMLAGVFAATMSTADSQLLSCSSSLLKDIFKIHTVQRRISKLATLSICAFIALLAIYANESVFSIVLLAWAVLAAAFAPIIILYALGQDLSEGAILSISSVSIGSCLLWSYNGLEAIFYSAGPGILTGLLYYFVVYKLLFANR